MRRPAADAADAFTCRNTKLAPIFRDNADALEPDALQGAQNIPIRILRRVRITSKVNLYLRSRLLWSKRWVQHESLLQDDIIDHREFCLHAVNHECAACGVRDPHGR